MDPHTIRAADTTLLVPTFKELDLLQRVAPGFVADHPWQSLEVIGFGPIAAAANAARIATELMRTTTEAEARPRPRLLLLGLAGRYDAGPDIGSAASFGVAASDGIGAGEGVGYAGAGLLGFAQLQARPGAPEAKDRIEFAEGPELVTVCAASEGAGMRAARQARHPGALCEEMEGYGVALGIRAAAAHDRLDLSIVRGISNEAGDRNVAQWRFSDALRAVTEHIEAQLG